MINGATARLAFNIIIDFCEQQRDGDKPSTCDDCAIKRNCRGMRRHQGAPDDLDHYTEKETKGANLEDPFDD